MAPSQFKVFSSVEHETWKRLFDNLDFARQNQATPIFVKGLEALGITAEKIPSLDDVNLKLKKLTGWQGVVEDGFKPPQAFFEGLARREFPIGNFIRDKQDLNYTPAPDVFHDLYGHMPFLADPDYAQFCEDFGKAVMSYAKTEEQLNECDSLFWYGVEFPLIETPKGRRIFGGGILSSYNECHYSLSDKPRVERFVPKVVRKTPFRIDVMQDLLFVLESEKDLYDLVRGGKFND